MLNRLTENVLRIHYKSCRSVTTTTKLRCGRYPEDEMKLWKICKIFQSVTINQKVVSSFALDSLWTHSKCDVKCAHFSNKSCMRWNAWTLHVYLHSNWKWGKKTQEIKHINDKYYMYMWFFAVYQNESMCIFCLHQAHFS